MYLVMLDVDGTLVDSQEIILAAQRETFAAHGLAPPDRERGLSIVGLSLHEAFAVLAGPDGPVASLVEAYREGFARLRADPALREPLFPGAEDFIAAMQGRGDVVLGIATGKSRRGVAHLVARHGWDRAFATIQTADDAPSKPDPAMLVRALAETGIAPDRAVMVGDSTYDMRMARDAGVGALGVAWGYHAPEALLAAGAETVCPSYAALTVHLASRLPA